MIRNLELRNQSLWIQEVLRDLVFPTNSAINSLVIPSNHVYNTTAPQRVVKLPKHSDPPQLSMPEDTLIASVILKDGLCTEIELSCNAIEGSKVRFKIKKDFGDTPDSNIFESPAIN
ncbi:unnamed protein product [Lepeophtheirus salmonis]|uniref:(salmon louse) hypothetical protein n=1 Tax=Lepeophtheirus salmonis TaxID=72036 RepID=A0A7R8H075_LEPSM|nr:unnamed protein product [Lepeophtheirus salmonis]CAF2764480.1 unnamed protein product [Lepeophtheirus salmonis]